MQAKFFLIKILNIIVNFWNEGFYYDKEKTVDLIQPIRLLDFKGPALFAMLYGIYVIYSLCVIDPFIFLLIYFFVDPHFDLFAWPSHCHIYVFIKSNINQAIRSL